MPTRLRGGALLAIASGVIGSRFVLRVKRDWYEPAHLWTAVVGETGTAKLPALEKAREPIEALQAEAHKTAVDERKKYEQALTAGDGGGDGAKKPSPPDDERHYYTTDATIEALCRSLGGPRSTTRDLRW